MDGTFVITRKNLPEALSKTSNTESENDDPTFKPTETMMKLNQSTMQQLDQILLRQK